MAALRGHRSRLAAGLLRLGGWRVVGDIPTIPKAVIIAAPHTSNWDFIVLVLAKLALGVKVCFIGKHTLFKGPLGWWLRSMGGMPVDRSRPGALVDEVVATFAREEAMHFALAPEGTRKWTPGWKTGFWRIATGAGVPIVPVMMDAGRYEVRIGAAIVPTGNITRDFAALQEAYAGVTGIRATLAAPIQPLQG